MALVDRFVSTVVGVIVEIDKVGHDIDLVVDVALLALQVPKTAEVDLDVNVRRAMGQRDIRERLPTWRG